MHFLLDSGNVTICTYAYACIPGTCRKDIYYNVNVMRVSGVEKRFAPSIAQVKPLNYSLSLYMHSDAHRLPTYRVFI